jgi:hypothetical protein
MPAAPVAALMGARLKGTANVIGAGSAHLSDKSIVGKPTHRSRGLGWYRRDQAAVGGLRHLPIRYSIK